MGVRREKDVWGEDAHQFNPERWLASNGKRASSVGVYSNLYVISQGVLLSGRLIGTLRPLR